MLEELGQRDDARARVQVVALTAHALAGDPEKCIQAGMDDDISKPVALAELGRVITELQGIPAQRSAG